MFIMLLPAIVLVVVFFIFPMINLGRLAFYKYDRIEIYVQEFTTGNFKKFFSDPYYWNMILSSLKVGLLTSFFCLVVGYPLAQYLTTSKGLERTFLTTVFLSGLFVSILVKTLGWWILLLPFGLIQRLLQFVGIADGPVHLLRTMPALIMVLVYIHLPYAVLILAASIQNVPREKLEAARLLGASEFKTFSKVTVPLIMPGIVSSCILVFTLSMSSYLIPILITGQRIRLLPIAIWSYTTQLLNWPFACAIALLLLIITVTGTYGFIVLTNKLARRGKWEMV